MERLIKIKPSKLDQKWDYKKVVIIFIALSSLPKTAVDLPVTRLHCPKTGSAGDGSEYQ